MPAGRALVCGRSARTPDLAGSVASVSSPTLAERLGHHPDTRLVILSCDDLGSCHSANVGVYRAIREGAATCASVMMPAPWARHAASLYEHDDIGVHLTLNAEHDLYRWGPLTNAPSLQSGDGGFPSSIEDLWEHADPDEVYRECRTQIERALAWGFDVSHLSPHISAMTLRPEFFGVYVELAVEFALPIRLPSTLSEEQVGFPFRNVASAEGLVFPDHFDHDWRAGSRARVLRDIADLQPGVTELHIQPVIDTPEVRAFAHDADQWIDDLALALDPALASAIEQSGAVLIGYRALREAMRGG
jgi:chitin disaccharide deacetylase